MNAGGMSQTGPEGTDMPGRQAAEGGGVSEGGVDRTAALERRYRRLLRCYPPSHREDNREEMLGVLLAVARPGQRTPDLWSAVNLVACGLAIRARRALSWLAAGEPWQDALAVVSLIGPVLMLIIATLDFAAAVREAAAMTQGIKVQGMLVKGPFWQPTLVPRLGGPAAVMIGWLAVVLLGLTGRRRTAAAIASVSVAVELVNLLTEVLHLSDAWYGGLPLFVITAGLVAPVTVAGLAACALAFSAGPRRGLAIAGRRRAWLMIACLSAGFGFPAIVQLVRPYDSSLAGSTFSLLGVLAIAVAVVVTRVRTTVDRRVAVLVATALLLDLANAFPTTDLTALLVFLLGSLLFVVLMWLVAIASWWGRGKEPAAGRA